jgi:hypothetical protein
MRRSSDRILTTHVGSPPAPEDVDLSAPESVAHLRETVDSIVEKQQRTRNWFSDIAADERFAKHIDDPCSLRAFA